MKTTLATAALAAILSVSAAGAVSAMPAAAPAPANATTGAPVELVGHRGPGVRHGHHRILPRHVIVRSLRHRGYRDIRNVHLRNGDYVLRARGYRGDVRLVVDGRTARILSRHLLRHGGHRSGVWFHGGNGNFSYSFGVR